jgi:hypothetical protein
MFLMWSVLSDERTSLLFTSAARPHSASVCHEDALPRHYLEVSDQLYASVGLLPRK